MSQIVGVWEVMLNGRLHQIEFEHGTTSGRRIIRVDGKVIYLFISCYYIWIIVILGHRQIILSKCHCSYNASRHQILIILLLDYNDFL